MELSEKDVEGSTEAPKQKIKFDRKYENLSEWGERELVDEMRWDEMRKQKARILSQSPHLKTSTQIL